MKIKRCQICNSKKIERIISLGATGLCDTLLTYKETKSKEKSYPLNLMRCKNCQLLQLDYIVNNKELFHLNYPYKSSITKPLVKLLQGTPVYLKQKFKFSKNPLAIDIGSNDGTLLKGFKKVKFETLGIEPTNISKIANRNGIKTIQRFFNISTANYISKKYKKASVITGTNLFAHVDKLNSFMKAIKILLDPKKGVFVTESHYAVDIIEDLQYDSIYHEHLRFYLVKPLIHLMEKHGFKIIDAIRIPNYGGSIRISATLNTDLKPNKNVKRLIDFEKRKGFYDKKKYKNFSKDVIKSKNNLIKILKNIKRKGENIVGIGCPGRSITLLSYCKINRNILDYIAEQSSSLKLNLFTPNTHIPVLDEENFFENQPEYALILSWHYGKSIMKNLRRKGYKGKFIVPLPFPKII
mgnify:CR=1 FL=1|tara:strand:- start:1312 stop:2541 length:1230 start_codon:yes stop_codon:yes gene_type:complete